MFFDKQTSSATTIVSSSGATSQTIPTITSDTSSYYCLNIHQFQEVTVPKSNLSGTEPGIYLKHLHTDILNN